MLILVGFVAVMVVVVAVVVTLVVVVAGGGGVNSKHMHMSPQTQIPAPKCARGPAPSQERLL